MKRIGKRTEMTIDMSLKDKELVSKESQHNDGFIRIVNAVFSAAQVFGVSTRCGRAGLVWCCVLFTMVSAVELGAMYKLFKTIFGQTLYSSGNRSVVARMSGAIFYGNAVCSLLVFWRFRKAWRKLSSEWLAAERTFGLDYPPDKYLKPKVAVVISVVIFGSLSEHLMSIVAKTDFQKQVPFLEWLRIYIIEAHAFLIIPSDYSEPLGFAMLLVSEASTVLWNFQDLVVILVGAGLSSRYARLNAHVRAAVSELSGDAAYCSPAARGRLRARWRRVREAYVRQAALVRRVDADVGALLLLCNATNFYFICLQVFNTLSESDVLPFNKAYYVVSVAWLCARACGVVLAAADVNVQSQRALRYIYKCPKQCYNIEVQRLEKQLTGDYVSLSGMGFFILDRSMLLQAAAAVFKYELVLLEYDKK